MASDPKKLKVWWEPKQYRLLWRSRGTYQVLWGFLSGASGKEPTCQWRFDPWDRKIPWGKAWQPTPVFLPGKFQGQRSLTGFSPQGCNEGTWLKWLSIHAHTPSAFRNTAKEPLNPNLAHKYPVLQNESEHHGIFKTLEFCISYRFLMLILELAKCSTRFSLTGHHPPLLFQE